MKQQQKLQSDTLSSCSGKIKMKNQELSFWQQLEEKSSCKFGNVKHPQRIIECYEQNKSFIYQVEEIDGSRKLIPDLVLEEKFPQFMINYFENLIEFK